jgi:hypothetical protein
MTLATTYIAILILSFVTGDNRTVEFKAENELTADDMCENARDYIDVRGPDARNDVREHGPQMANIAASRVVGAFCIPAGLRSDWGDRPRKLPECFRGAGMIPDKCTPEEKAKDDAEYLRDHPVRPPGPDTR